MTGAARSFRPAAPACGDPRDPSRRDLPRPRRLDQIGEHAFGALSMAVRRAVEDSADS